MKNRSFAALLGVILAQTAGAQTPSYDLILRNARVVDGTGSPWYRAGIAIRGDMIARIAPSITESAARVSDVPPTTTSGRA